MISSYPTEPYDRDPWKPKITQLLCPSSTPCTSTQPRPKRVNFLDLIYPCVPGPASPPDLTKNSMGLPGQEVVRAHKPVTWAVTGEDSSSTVSKSFL